ncbi:cupredoxin domain-containing protein [Tumebacillus sp. ITR2]|uniref:Cupredoxin domain-containing protein n=1 Tax=Tumebacillus amylolyticus TaxID=2801339 RepID=A0ABS1JG09_9BACL|nr:cupredoxin domain-containing protein [Tumebacillus amylolyticus]MBL0389165.1 cupredoxin domain-containing protein [Tumebacillus amylolyticus]
MKKFTLLAATSVVAFGMILAGCGSSSDSSSTASTSGSTSSSTSSTTTKDSSTTATTTTPATTTESTGDEQVIHVTAKNFAWTLDKTEVKVGKPVKLIVTASEGMHALSIDGTDVKDVHAMSGKEETATFTPTKAGDLDLKCTQMCGVGHGTMVTKLKVTE